MTENGEAFEDSSNGEDRAVEAEPIEEKRVEGREEGSMEENPPPESQEPENISTTTTPSVESCRQNRKGYCEEHRCQGKRVTVSSKKWKDRGGGRGYGYVTQRVTRFICVKRVTAVSEIKSTFEEGRGSVNNTITKSRNLDQLEQIEINNFSGDTEGATTSWVSESLSGLPGQADITGD